MEHKHTCSRIFFQGGGQKVTAGNFRGRGSRWLAGFQPYQPDFQDSSRIFPIFPDENSQPYFLAVFSRILRLEGEGKYPWTYFSLKLAQKCLKFFLCLLHLTQHGSIRSGGNILLFILKLMLKFLICFGKVLGIGCKQDF